METINGLYKAECIRTLVFHDGPYRTIADVEFATACWVDWYNQRRLPGSLGMMTPVQFEQATQPRAATRMRAAENLGRFTARKSASLTQQQLADRSGAHITQIRRYEAGTSQPTLDVLRSLALALNIRADSLLFDDERGPQNPTLRLRLEAVDQFTPDEQERVAAFIEGALLRHLARQVFSGQAS